MDERISGQLKDTREQREVVGPLVEYLGAVGWSLDQIIFGRREWRMPKTPSEQSKRQRGQSYDGFPVDIAVFDAPQYIGDYQHLLFIIECKLPDDDSGQVQLEAYFTGEPYAKLGMLVNNPEPASEATYLYRSTDGTAILKKQQVANIPKPGEAIRPDFRPVTFNDLITPTQQLFQSIISDLLDKVVIGDPNVTRREEQLDQLCNVLLLKLASDKRAKSDVSAPVKFQPQESANRTGAAIRTYFKDFVELFPDTFISEQDKNIRFSDATIYACVEALSGLKLLDLGVSTVSVAFQVLRSEALKQGEGQYFTPQAVIEAGVRLLRIDFDDIVIDPACGTGGFLVECILDLQRKQPDISEADVSRWAQLHIFGIEKDAIGLKLTKAIMQIAGDGSAHCVRGDSIRTYTWAREYPSLTDNLFKNGRFSVVVTNPPFGQNLKVSASDARLSNLDIARDSNGVYRDLEIGLLFLQRAHQLLKIGGRIGIVLPETYFFSKNYLFVFDWMKGKLKPIVVLNIPMEAFQGFCRAKTNFYIFEKVGE